MNKLRKGDQVVVISGKDKGRRGAIVQVLSNDRVIVEGLNMAKRHQKPNPQAGKQGGILEKEMPLHVSKVALFNPASKKADKIGFRKLDNGKKVRFFKSNGEQLDA